MHCKLKRCRFVLTKAGDSVSEQGKIMNLTEKHLREKLASLKNQLNYVLDKLSDLSLKEWELKEYSNLKNNYEIEMQELEQRISIVF